MKGDRSCRRRRLASDVDGLRHRRHVTVRCRKRDERCDRTLCFRHKVRGYLRREIIRISHRIYPVSHLSSLLMLRNVSAEALAANRPRPMPAFAACKTCPLSLGYVPFHRDTSPFSDFGVYGVACRSRYRSRSRTIRIRRRSRVRTGRRGRRIRSRL